MFEKLATRPSPRFLGLFRGIVYDYEAFDEAVLESDLERIERYYRARGYYEARVTAARVIVLDRHRVEVELEVVEGIPIVVHHIDASGLENLPIDSATRALEAITLQTGAAFDEAIYDASKRAVLSTLLDAGYAFASVSGQVDIDVAQHRALIAFRIVPGPLASYGPIELRGLREIDRKKVIETLDLQPGEQFSKSAIEDARRALSALGVFSTIRITPDLGDQGSRQVPLLIEVEESPPRTVRLGGGVSFDTLSWSNHLTAGWEHRNLWGGLRHLAVEAQPGVILFPTNVSTFEAPDRALITGRVRANFRQPAFLEGRTTGVLTTRFDVYPLIYPTSERDDPLVGFIETNSSFGLERFFVNHVFHTAASYHWQAIFPIDYSSLTLGPKIPPPDTAIFERIVVSYPELDLYADLRDNPIEPHQGAFFGVGVQGAVPALGGDVSDIRVLPEARAYAPISRRVTLATRVAVGLLFPFDYGDTLSSTVDVDPESLAIDQQKLLFRAFFSGGPNSNRGYPFRGVGPHGPLGFLSQSSIDCLLPENENNSLCQGPLGGLSLWEASLEVRFPVAGDLGATTFVDTSDVTREVASFRTDSPHLSVGLGLRYSTPVGPLRLDAGYRVPGLQSSDEAEESPEPLFPGGPPMAVYFGLGEAF